ncbi:hypothetical protein VO54_02046 [Elizabethkingia miricola]|nr:hypothetical protein VO54_02046 [Elizabethkingia miricola]
MKYKILSVIFLCALALCFSCKSSVTASSNIDVNNVVLSDNYFFSTNILDNRKEVSYKAGRIFETRLPQGANEFKGIKVINGKEIIVRLPKDSKDVDNNITSINAESKNIEVVRQFTDSNGHWLVNVFLKDNNDIKVVKFDIDKSGKAMASVEGPKLEPLLFEGIIGKN